MGSGSTAPARFTFRGASLHFLIPRSEATRNPLCALWMDDWLLPISIPAQAVQREKRIHRARSKSFQIECYELETERLEDPRKLGGHVAGQGARHFLLRNLEAHHLAMVAHAELPETQFANGIFATFNHAEIFAGDWTAILDSGRKAGRRRFVPDTKARRARQISNILLLQACVQQRREHMVLLRGTLSRTEIALIVHIHAIGDRVVISLAPQ